MGSNRKKLRGLLLIDRFYRLFRRGKGGGSNVYFPRRRRAESFGFPPSSEEELRRGKGRGGGTSAGDEGTKTAA